MILPGRSRWFALLIAGPTLCFAAEGSAKPNCATCHPAETAAFPQTGMSRALESVKDCVILKQHPELSATIGGYHYEITRQGDETRYSVTDGKNKISVLILWAFGQGAVGQTYVFERDGRLFESRVSYFTELNGLDLTMGAANRAPSNLDEAAGRLMSATETRDCFGCHSTGLVLSDKMHPDQLTPGIQCARCHTGAQQHAQAASTGDVRLAAIQKLSQLSTEEISDFCGQCHRTWSQIATDGPHTILNVRFQPYRLTSSKCYDAVDPRIRCTACHNPHHDLETKPAAYDAKCLACHSTAATPPTPASAHICRVSRTNCVSCHMPKTELPGAHYQFSDHRIRIVRAGEKYPD